MERIKHMKFYHSWNLEFLLVFVVSPTFVRSVLFLLFINNCGPSLISRDIRSNVGLGLI